MSSEAMKLNFWHKRDLVLYVDGFQLPESSQRWEIIEIQIYFCVSQNEFSTTKISSKRQNMDVWQYTERSSNTITQCAIKRKVLL